MKKLLIILGLIISVNANDCDYAYSKATYYSNITSKGTLDTKENACKQADALEQLVNWMGTMEQSCPNFSSKYGTVYELNKKLLVVAISKCGH